MDMYNVNIFLDYLNLLHTLLLPIQSIFDLLQPKDTQASCKNVRYTAQAGIHIVNAVADLERWSWGR